MLLKRYWVKRVPLRSEISPRDRKQILCRQIAIFAGIFGSEEKMREKKENMILYAGMLFFLGVEIFQISGAKGKLLELMVRIILYVGAVLVVYGAARLGCRWYEEKSLKKWSLMYCAGFYGLYVLSGTCQQLSKGADLLDNLIRTAFLVSVPKTAENWLFGAAVFALLGMAVPAVYRLRHKKLWLPVLALAGLTVTLIPGDFFGYPLFGVFLGMDDYRCMPVLAFSGYFLWGMLADKIKKRHTMLFMAAAFVFSVLVCLWKREALLSKMRFPIHYWEVLLPVGFAAVVILILSEDKTARVLSRVLPAVFPLTAAEIAAWYVIRAAFGAQGSALKIALITAVIYLLMFPAEMVYRRIRSWIRNGEYKNWSRGYGAYVLAYSLGFAILAVLVFMPFWEKGRTFIWNMDGISQYLPRMASFSRMVRDCIASLFHGELHFNTYDFTWGLGDHVALNFNPLYWCYALFAPEQMELGYQVMTLVNFYLTGLSASALLLYLKKGRFASLMGSYAYVFCGYALHLCLYHPQFSYGFILLPLMILAVEEILTRNRWYLGTIVVGMSLLWNYYFLYVNTIAAVMYFIVRFVLLEKENRKLQKFVQYIGTFAGAYLLGVGIGFLGIMTTFSSYVGSSRSSVGSFDTPSGGDYGASWILGMFQGLINTGRNPAYSLRLGFTALVWIAIVIMFLRRKKRKKNCILFLLCFVACCFPVVGYVWNGFAYVSNRWTYVMALLMAALIADMVKDIPSLTKSEIKKLFYSTIPYIIVLLFYGEFDSYNGPRALAVLLVALVVVILSSKAVGVFDYRGMKIGICLVMAGSLLVNSNVYFTDDGLNNVRQFAKAGKVWQKATDTGIQAVQVEDEEFYRAATTNTDPSKLSGSLLENVNGITYYNSTYNSLISEFMASLGVVGVNKVRYSGFDNRAFLNTLACVKYYVTQAENGENAVPFGYDCIRRLEDKYEKEDGKEDYLLFQTENVLPIGYTYDRAISRSEFETYSPMEKQEILMTHAVVEEEVKPVGDDISLTGKTITPSYVELSGAELEDGVLTFDADAQITVSFEGTENAETYLYFKGYTEYTAETDGCTWMSISDGKHGYSSEVWSRGNRYDTGQDYYVFNAGYHEDALCTVTFSFAKAGKLHLEDWGVYVQPMEQYESYVQKLGQETLREVSVDHNRVSGEITLDRHKLLVLSIPYEKGWTAMVDGKKVQLSPVNIMYTGIQLEAGEHRIELTYRRPGIKLGAAVSGISILVFAALIWLQRKRKYR